MRLWLWIAFGLLPVAPTLAQVPDAATIAASPPAELAGHRDNPRDFEGVWMPSMGPIPKIVNGKPVGLPPGGPGGLGAPALGGPAAIVAAGSTLQCTPVWRLSGAGGGMSNQWVMGSHEILVVSEEDQDVARKIYLGAQHPAHLVPQPNGHSIGHWEDNTLVVDTIGFGDAMGHPIDRHVVERFTKQGNVLLDEATVTEGNNVSKRELRSDWRPDLHVWENVCEEGFGRYSVVNGKMVISNTFPDKQ